MIDASPELKKFLATARSFVMADLYTIVLASGQVLRYTDAGLQIYYAGQNYSASGPLIKRTGVRAVRGIEVDTLNVTFTAGLNDTALGESVLPFIAGGGFDGATLNLARAFMVDWGKPVVGAVTRFIGRVAEVDPADREQATVTVKSPMELLDTKVPRGCISRRACARCTAPIAGLIGRCSKRREWSRPAATPRCASTPTYRPNRVGLTRG
ncbi:baseplate hub protein [Pseudomonas frederiksbergensis]|uniref:Bacteriophage phiJL001 Gp84 N-terminal domain-containing protein n=1 Tax=Pseudomonas frederiksbergensis TaxID=104087 RepID=A0AB33E939_9PSED|nr:DUF2163 domain-containing protein [Pseudomonas frederiksbergensis]ATE76630.1 hypothetical protein CNN82_09420 [Pseudomonas frederiksbergensis]